MISGARNKHASNLVYYSLLILCIFVVLAKTAKATCNIIVYCFIQPISQGRKASVYWPLTISRLRFFLPFLIAHLIVPYDKTFFVVLLHSNLSNAPIQNLIVLYCWKDITLKQFPLSQAAS